MLKAKTTKDQGVICNIHANISDLLTRGNEYWLAIRVAKASSVTLKTRCYMHICTLLCTCTPWDAHILVLVWKQSSKKYSCTAFKIHSNARRLWEMRLSDFKRSGKYLFLRKRGVTAWMRYIIYSLGIRMFLDSFVWTGLVQNIWFKSKEWVMLTRN